MIGGSDDKKILGLEADLALTRNEIEWFQQTLVNFINDQIGPEYAPSYRIRFCASEGHQICVVDVLERAPKPAYLKDGDASEFYVRTSNKTVPLKGEELQTYVEMHWRK